MACDADNVGHYEKKRLIVRTFVFFSVAALLVFGSSNTEAWPGARIYLALIAVIGFGTWVILARSDPALLVDRMRLPIQKEQEGWDKALIGALLMLYIGWLVLIELDIARHWSSVPTAVQVIGTILIGLTICIRWLAIRENKFATPVVNKSAATRSS